MQQIEPVLGYWSIRGRAQPIRLLFEYLQVQYTEKRYKDPAEWFERDKVGLELDYPNLPYLIEGTAKLTETFTIMKYLCLKHNRADLTGRTADDALRLSTVQGVLTDLINDTYSLCCDEEFRKIKDEIYMIKLKPRLQSFSKSLGRNDFIIGRLSYLDFVLFEIMEMYVALDSNWMEEFQNLLGLHKRIRQIPAIKNYMDSNRYIKKPFLLPELAEWSGM